MQAKLHREISLASTISDTQSDGESKIEKYHQDGMKKIEELIQTEKKYIEDMKLIGLFSNYIQKSKNKESGVAPMPDDLSDGRDRIVFANSRDLLDFHQR